MRITKRDFWQFIRFMLCNQTAWLADLGVFTLLYEAMGAHYIAAKALSYSVGALVSYTLNRKITFKTAQRFVSRTLAKFIAVNCISIALSLGSMAVFNDVCGLPVWVGYFLSIVFSFTTNFLGNRFWVFRGLTKEDV